MDHGERIRNAIKLGSVPEAAREEEALRYAASLLAESVVNDSTYPLATSHLPVSSDPALAAFAQLAALKLDVDRALVSIFDSKRQHVITEVSRSAAIDLAPDDARVVCSPGEALYLSGTAIPRSYGACEHVLDLPAVQSSGRSLLPISVVPDLTRDERFCSKPYFGPDSPLRFYAGVPLRSPQGIDFGVCCVFDSRPRDVFDLASQRVLRHMSRLVMSHLQSRVSAESYRRHERMVRGLGSMVEGSASMSKWRDAANPESFADIEGQEGGLNLQQQHIQNRVGRFPLEYPQRPRPPPIPLQSEEALQDGPEAVAPADSTDSLTSDLSKKSCATFDGRGNDEGAVLTKLLFSRAANIIREAVEVEGALFLDASVGSYGGLVPKAAMPHRDQDQGRSSASSGEESATTDDNLAAPEFCRNLGFSTSDQSSINGDPTPSLFSTVPDGFLERILRRYPRGQIFNFDDDGTVIWAVSDSEGSEAGKVDDAGQPRRRSEGRRIPNRPRKGDAAFLIRLFPGARSIALVPLWDSHKERWYAGGFVWTRARARVFTVEGELSYLKAFGAATMAEVARMDVLRESKAKEDVLGSLSHEIRSPLHGVMLGVELMHDSVLTGFQEDVLHTVETCGRTLLDTLDHLLDFSKVNHFLQAPARKALGGTSRGLAVDSLGRNTIEAGMMSIFSDLSLDLLLEEVVESVYAGFSFQNTSNRWAARDRSANTSYFEQGNSIRRLESVRQMDTSSSAVSGPPRFDTGVRIYLSVDPNVPWEFNAQPGALRRIVMNIFGNALKYTSKGSILVSLTQGPTSAKMKSRRRTVVFSVSDSGKGISTEYLRNRLYTPFAQENQLSSGAGLGLSIVKQIVHGLGARIGIESRVDHGTTVRISIPLRLSSPRASPAAIPSEKDDFDDLVKRLEGSSVSLIGFPEDFGNYKPLAAENAESRLSPKLFVESLCQRYLHLRVLSELEMASTIPSFCICTEQALDQIPASAPPPPVVVMCDNALAAHELSTKCASSTSPIMDCFSQPIGPRKLAKILVVISERWKSTQASSHDQTSSTASTAGPEPAALSQNGGFPHDQILPADPLRTANHADSTMSLPLLPGPPAPSRPTLTTHHSGSTLRPASASPHAETELESPRVEEEPAAFLLVDDNAINLKILASYMKKLSRGHDNAVNGLEALEACRSRTVNYRCIFMDISMPVMDGLEATRLIRAHEQGKRLKPALIVALTGLASAQTQQEAYASGIDLFLTKPVPLKELGRILEARGV